MAQLYGAVLDFIRDRFKGDFTPDDKTETVGTTAMEVMHGDADRVTLTFVNLGTSTIYIRPHPEVSATAGLRVGPSGGMISVNVEEDNLLPALNWYAVSTAAGGTLYLLWARRTRLEQV